MTAGRRDFPLWSTLFLQFRPHFSFGKSEDKSVQPEQETWKRKSNMKTEILMTAIFLTASAIEFVKRTARHLTLLRSQMSDKNWPSLAVKKFIFPLLFVGYA